MRFHLRTLMIVLALAPPLLALIWWAGRLIVEFGPRPRGIAETLVCCIVAGLLTFAIGGVFVERRARRQRAKS